MAEGIAVSKETSPLFTSAFGEGKLLSARFTREPALKRVVVEHFSFER